MVEKRWNWWAIIVAESHLVFDSRTLQKEEQNSWSAMVETLTVVVSFVGSVTAIVLLINHAITTRRLVRDEAAQKEAKKQGQSSLHTLDAKDVAKFSKPPSRRELDEFLKKIGLFFALLNVGKPNEAEASPSASEDSLQEPDDEWRFIIFSAGSSAVDDTRALHLCSVFFTRWCTWSDPSLRLIFIIGMQESQKDLEHLRRVIGVRDWIHNVSLNLKDVEGLGILARVGEAKSQLSGRFAPPPNIHELLQRTGVDCGELSALWVPR